MNLRELSIIIPVYNVQKYLHQCIQSILNQTLKCIEIILIDDGSTDKSGLICDEYAKKDSRILVFHQQNSGQAAARNLGLKKASGAWIGFVDADDYIDEYMFQKLLENAKENNSDISICGYYEVYLQKILGYPRKRIKPILTREEAITEALIDGSYGQFVWNKVFRRELWEGIAFPNCAFEDVAILYQVLERAEKVSFIDLPLYYYRQWRGSMTHQCFSVGKMDILKHYEKMIAHFKKRDDSYDQVLYAALLIQCLRFYVQILETGLKQYDIQYYTLLDKVRSLKRHIRNPYIPKLKQIFLWLLVFRLPIVRPYRLASRIKIAIRGK